MPRGTHYGIFFNSSCSEALFFLCLTNLFDNTLIKIAYCFIILWVSYPQKWIHASVYWKLRKYSFYSLQDFFAIWFRKLLGLGKKKIVYPKYPRNEWIFEICLKLRIMKENAFHRKNTRIPMNPIEWVICGEASSYGLYLVIKLAANLRQ